MATTHYSWIFDFAFYYPLFMAYFWLTGAIYYYFHWERKTPTFDQPPTLKEYPKVSVLVPCHNEGENAYETIGALLKLNYPNFDVILVNDGSKDNTGTILEDIASREPRVRVVHLTSNQGKAMGLCMASMLTDSEFLMCIDGDAILDKNSVLWIMWHFVNGPRVGAVTGNPRIRNRSTLLGRLQVGEFSSIIGLIKRTQRIYGRIFTVSGVITGFRKSALHNIGYWSTDMITEDIDISWKMQTNFYEVRYEPNALCWILMPETLSGLWKQRTRWAQGGAEVMLKYAGIFTRWKNRRMWIVYLELMVSLIWAYLILIIFALWAIGNFVTLPDYLYIKTLVPGWNGVILAMTCLLQFAVSLIIDSRYEHKIKRYYYWMIWYPLAYWLISAAASIVGFPKALFRDRTRRATWVSPDRGIQQKKPNLI